MKKQTYYFRTDDSERCHPAEYFHSDMIEQGLTEMEVFEAIPEKVQGAIWCNAVDEVALREDYPCGKGCEDYEPRNGKSGCCKYNGRLFTTGEKVTLKLKP